tara:strand:- start:873 stop:1502 length:630 start_codon:yes stop_codon:yes gene_type:complete
MNYSAFKNVSLKINKKIILDNISFEIPKHKTTIFLGKNGSGKTTILRTINLLQKITSGEIISNNQKPIPMLFQKPIIFEGNALYNFSILKKIKNYEANLIWHDAFELSLTHQQDIKKLSGGEKQKLFLSRVMSVDPEVIIMDEPNQNLDLESEKTLTQLIIDQKIRNKTIILTLHDYKLAKRLADFIILLDKGKILYQGKGELFFDQYN